LNYQKIYKKLIAKRQKYVLEENYEKHHIIPRTIGGDDLESNLVKLTPREHYIAHLLLTKIHPKEDGLKIAWQLMACTRDNFSKVKFSSKMYQKLKLEVRKAQSSFMIGTTKNKCEWRMRSALKAKERIGEKHNLWGFKHSKESKLKMSRSRKMGDNHKAKKCELEILNLNTVFECSCLKESWILLKSEKIFDKSYDSFKSSFRENNLKKYSDLFIVDLI
jgi:hypothetical protein